MSKSIIKGSNALFQKKLLERRGELKERLEDIKKEDPFANQSRLNESLDPGAESVDQFDHERVEAMTEEIEGSLVEVEMALKRIDNGEYGNCVECGAEINRKRLEIEPATSLCMTCQRKKEKSPVIGL